MTSYGNRKALFSLSVGGIIIWSHLRTGALEPENFGQIVSAGAVDGLFKHLYLLHQSQVVVVWWHLGIGEGVIYRFPILVTFSKFSPYTARFPVINDLRYVGVPLSMKVPLYAGQPVAWGDVRCWAWSSSSPCSLWWESGWCRSGAPSLSVQSWETEESQSIARCWCTGRGGRREGEEGGRGGREGEREREKKYSFLSTVSVKIDFDKVSLPVNLPTIDWILYYYAKLCN